MTEFEWDPEKAESNLRKHGVSFVEAASVFFDTLSVTIPDPLHSAEEDRFVITGLSTWLCILIGVLEYESLARAWLHPVKGRDMSRQSNNDHDPEMLEEYDFRRGVRGKYVGRFAQGANVVVLDPDVAEVFTDSESVNQALRALAGIIQHQSDKAHP